MSTDPSAFKNWLEVPPDLIKLEAVTEDEKLADVPDKAPVSVPPAKGSLVESTALMLMDPPRDTAVELMLIEELLKAELGMLLSEAPDPLKVPAVTMPEAVMVVALMMG